MRRDLFEEITGPFIPLKPLHWQILLVLSVHPLRSHRILQKIRDDFELQNIHRATYYTSIQSLLQNGLIERKQTKDYYSSTPIVYLSLTQLGKLVAKRQVEHLGLTVRLIERYRTYKKALYYR